MFLQVCNPLCHPVKPSGKNGHSKYKTYDKACCTDKNISKGTCLHFPEKDICNKLSAKEQSSVCEEEKPVGQGFHPPEVIITLIDKKQEKSNAYRGKEVNK